MPPAPALVRALASAARRHAAWILVCLAYLFPFPYFERLNNPNENVRVWATRAIVEHHALNIDQTQAEWGYVNDKAINAGHLYSSKAPGATFLGVPVLYVQTKLRHLFGEPSPGKRDTTFWLRLLAIKVPLCVFLFFFARHVERVTRSRAARDLLVVGLGLGTLVYPYGQMFVGHALAAAAAFGSYMLLAPPGVEPGLPAAATRRGLAWAGVLAGLAVAFEYQAAIVSALLALYALSRHRVRSASFFAGTLAPAALLGLFHTALFGRPWRFPYAFIENPEYLRTAHSAGFHGLALPHLDAIGSSLFAPDYGLFIFSPVLALGVIAALVAVARGARRDGTLVVAVGFCMLLFLGGMSNWRGGWCVGPRYITTVAPFMMFGLALAWPVIGARPWLSGIVTGAIVVSVLLNVVSGAVYPHYPEVFDNPVFDLTLPLLRQRYVPYGFGWWIGLRGLLALAPLALVVAGALALGARGDGARWPQRTLRVAVAALVAVVLLVPLSAYGRRPSPGEDQAAAFVKAIWEPPPVR